MNTYLEFLRTELGSYLSSRDKKPLEQQWREARALWDRYRCLPYHYLKHRLYERSAGPDFIDYLPAKLVRRFRCDHNPRSLVHLLNDKLETVRVVAGAGVRCVETLFSIDEEGTLRRADGTCAEAASVAYIVRGHSGRLFVKPINARAGIGAFSVDPAAIDAAWIRSKRNVVVQPALRNHPYVDCLHPGSLNTLRVSTFVENGRCTLIAACLRVGTGDAMVDNFSQGGIGVGIDLKGGRLNRVGITNGKFGRVLHPTHPDSKVTFASATLPLWRETCDLAERAALALQPHVTLGLDIAITPDGPVFVEGNEAADVFFLQEACGPVGRTLLGERVLAHWLRTHP